MLPNTQAPASARAALRDKLETVLAPEILDLGTLLVSELVTNSVRHAGLRPTQRITLSARASPGRLRVEVVEPGRGFDADDLPEPWGDGPATEGWGLYLVDQLSSSWGVQAQGETRVWFEVEGTSQAS
jgi:anti-sigma regulatory factor (Ser/Thr protein kinase)